MGEYGRGCFLVLDVVMVGICVVAGRFVVWLTGVVFSRWFCGGFGGFFDLVEAGVLLILLVVMAGAALRWKVVVEGDVPDLQEKNSNSSFSLFISPSSSLINIVFDLGFLGYHLKSNSYNLGSGFMNDEGKGKAQLFQILLSCI